MLIVPNSEHTLASAIPEVLSCLGTTIRSIAAGITQRPSFTYSYNETDGSITVTIPQNIKHGKVVLRHSQTLQDVRRDFRWVRQANNYTQACKWPFIPLKKPLFGGNCIQPIIWYGTTLKKLLVAQAFTRLRLQCQRKRVIGQDIMWKCSSQAIPG